MMTDRRLATAITSVRLASRIIEPDDGEVIGPAERLYWEGMARGLRLACALIEDGVGSDPQGEGGET